MSFLSPAFLAGALAIAIPLALHLLKRHPEQTVRFSAVHLLRTAPVEHASRRRLRELLLLALRVTALLLLALAFARPFLTSGQAMVTPSTTIVALDTSASMSAPGQFERARERARQAVTAAPNGAAVGVVLFGSDAEVAAAPGSDRGAALAAIAAATPGAGRTRYRAGLATAAQLLRTERATVIVVTDLQASGWDRADTAELPATADVQVVDIGAPPANLAITALAAAGDRLVGTVRNTGVEPREARLQLRLGQDSGGGAVAGSELRVTVPPGESLEFAVPRPSAAWASMTVNDDVGMQADNTRYAILGGSARPRALVVTATGDLDREAFYVHQALIAAGADGSAYDVEGVSGNGLQSWTADRVSEFSSIVLLSTRGLDRRARELIAGYVRSGGGVLIAAGGDVDGDVASEALGGTAIAIAPPADRTAAAPPRTLAPADMRHPVLQPFASASSLSLARFTRITGIRGAGCQTLARFTTGESALLECRAGNGRALILSSDLDNKGNDFPLHATFLPFLHRSLAYLSRPAASAEYLVGGAPAGAPALPGVAMIAREGGAPRLSAVNVDPAESDPARLTPDEFQTGVTRTNAVSIRPVRSDNEEQEDRQHLWRYGLMLMAVVLLGESVLAARTS